MRHPVLLLSGPLPTNCFLQLKTLYTVDVEIFETRRISTIAAFQVMR